MRCCLTSLAMAFEQGNLITQPGAELQCQYCHDWMRVADDGIWEWARKIDQSV